MRLVESQGPDQEFLHDCGLQVVFRTIEQETNLTEQLLVRREGAGTGLGRLHVAIHIGRCGIIVEQKFYQLIAYRSKARTIGVRSREMG